VFPVVAGRWSALCCHSARRGKGQKEAGKEVSTMPDGDIGPTGGEGPGIPGPPTPVPPRPAIEVPDDLPPSYWERATTFQLIYSLGGLILGLACIIGGIVLFLHGVTGSTSWTTEIIGLESELSDAAPGTVLFIVGLFLVFVTRYVVKTRPD
jgi:hypothetical protein